MSGGITDDDGARAAINRGGIEPLHRLGVAARSVLGDIHHLKPQRNGILNSLLRRLQQELVGPTFGVAADRTGSEKSSNLDVQAGFVHDFGNRPNVILVRAGSAVGLDLHLLIHDLTRQRRHVFHCSRACAG